MHSAMEQCRQQGAESVNFHECDMAQPAQIKDLFSFIKVKYGRTPDILVNNAGGCSTMFLYKLLLIYFLI